MIPAAFAPLASHLWQSTLFAAGAGALTLALRRNQARVRYWVWLGASYKFLLPFSLLVSLGHQFEWRTTPTIIPAAFSTMTDAVNQPLFLTSRSAAKLTPDHLPVLLLVICSIWVCGFVTVAAGWARQWLGIRAVVRAASPLHLDLPIRAVFTSARLEPGVVGIFRPVLLLPEGISGRLTPAQLQMVLAHEMCHVRRRDNLAAAMHMLVEALFWFHPLVWWLGVRMIDERERACDEEVLQSGSEAQAYAESILKVCEFYLQSPLTCISGITGSDLKKRIERIMKKHFGTALSARKKFFLATAGAAALAVPFAIGMLRLEAQSPSDFAGRPKFDVASIKVNKNTGVGRINLTQAGGHVTASNVSLKFLMIHAYQPSRVHFAANPVGAGWIESEHFDVEAEAEGNPTVEQKRLMIRSLLVDRFKLTMHQESRQLPEYALVLSKAGKTGPQLHPHNVDTKCVEVPVGQPMQSSGLPPCGGLRVVNGNLVGQNVTIEKLAETLSVLVDRNVVDRTGLAGNFDVTMQFQVPRSPEFGLSPSVDTLDPSGPPSIFTALQEQLGMKLESQTGPVNVMIIDHVEEPSEN